MIDINLVPDNLKKKRRGALLASHGLLPRETVIAVIGGFLLLLLVFHVLLQIFIAGRFIQLKMAKKQWERILPEKTNIDRVLYDLRTLQTKVKAMEAMPGNKKVLWAKKLNQISNAVPRGAWLNQMQLNEKMLVIQGSAVSKTNTEMISVHTFTSNLKNDADFMSSFKAIELGLIKSRKINVTPVADFTITAELK